MWAFGLHVIYMGEKMNKLTLMLKKRPAIFIGALIFLLLTVVTVYAVRPTISLNSPTSFPVDI